MQINSSKHDGSEKLKSEPLELRSLASSTKLSSDMSRRQSIVVHGIGEEDQVALAPEDETFYGLSVAADKTLSGFDSDESDTEPPEKQPCDPDADEAYSDDEAGDVPLTAAANATHIAESIAEHCSTGCGCATNHWVHLDASELEQVVITLRSRFCWVVLLLLSLKKDLLCSICSL